VKWRTSYVIIAVLLTVLDGVVTVYYGTAIWIAWAGDIPARGLLVSYAALEATSLANVWVQAGSGWRVFSQSLNAGPSEDATPIVAEARGRSDV
jgi:hypothetical protein